MLTFAGINTAIQAEMQLDPGLVADSERLRFINDALSQIGSLGVLDKVAETTTAAEYPTKPTDLFRLQELYCDGVPLAYIQSGHESTTTGTPIGYALEAEAVRLYPAPSASVSLTWHYVYVPVACASITSSATPDIPEGWDSMIVDYACYRSHRKNGNYLSSAQYKKDFDSALAMRVRESVVRMNAKKKTSSVTSPMLSGDYFRSPADDD